MGFLRFHFYILTIKVRVNFLIAIFSYLRQITIRVLQGAVFLSCLQDRLLAAAIMLLLSLPSCLCHPYLSVNGSLYSFNDFLSRSWSSNS